MTFSNDLLNKINELVIQAAAEGIPEEDILDAVYQGLELVLGPPEEEEQ